MKPLRSFALLLLFACDAEDPQATETNSAKTVPRIVQRAELLPSRFRQYPDTEEGRKQLAACYPGTTEAEVLELHPPSKYVDYPIEIRAVLRRADIENSICRGIPGPDTLRACNRRLKAMQQAEKLGWCWGSEDRLAMAAEEHWLRCSEDALHGRKAYLSATPAYSEAELAEWAKANPVYPEEEMRELAKECP
jgi:hypothetical protein